MSWLLEQEPLIRLGAFVSILAAMALWEILGPRRKLEVPKAYRWVNNWSIVVLDVLAVRLVFPAGAVTLAVFVESQGWGIFQYLAWPQWLAVVLSVIILDFAVWLQHVIFHFVPALWRFHRMHHADLDVDVTTGLRFHPVEILISMVIKAAAIVVLGAPAVAVLIFEVLLNATSMFNHSNVRVPAKLEPVLRWIIVTPDMHRIHHSWDQPETDSNFGFNLPWWDRLLGTYRAWPKGGHEGMVLGLERFRERTWLRLDKLLLLPFTGDTGRDRKSGE